jgi:nucleoid DNA-binding protein
VPDNVSAATSLQNSVTVPLSGSLTMAKIIDAVAESDEIVLELIKQPLESGEDVLISGFGKFSVLI